MTEHKADLRTTRTDYRRRYCTVCGKTVVLRKVGTKRVAVHANAGIRGTDGRFSR